MSKLKENWGFILFTICFLILCAIGGYKYQDRARVHEELIRTKEKYVQLTQNIANLERKYVDQQKLMELTKEQFGKESNALRGRIKVLSNATYLIRERARREHRSDISYAGTKVKYIFNELRFNGGPPIGYVLIFDDGRVVSKIYNHEINVKSVISRDEKSGKYDVLSRADFILKSGHLKPDGKNWFGVAYPLKITGGITHIDPTEPVNTKKSFYIWAPKLNTSVNIHASEIIPGFGVSLMGYGFSKRDLDYKFLQLGLQYNKEDIGLTFSPILYRPFMNTLSNTYFGPGISVDANNQRYFMGIQIGL